MMTELESKLQKIKQLENTQWSASPEREFQDLKMKSAQAEIGDNFKQTMPWREKVVLDQVCSKSKGLLAKYF